MKLEKRSGFTLLEVIIVIIIVGVLASLALPRFFATVEYSKSTEALQAIATIRQSLERCYVKEQDYSNCTNIDSDLDIEDPTSVPGSHFSYAITSAAIDEYVVTATRTTYDGTSAATNTISIENDSVSINKSGTGKFSDI